jgi:hypothetical protein
VLAALPGARLLEVGDWGLREASWATWSSPRAGGSSWATRSRFLRYLT